MSKRDKSKKNKGESGDKGPPETLPVASSTNLAAGSRTSTPKKTVKQLFRESKTRDYFFEPFLLFAGIKSDPAFTVMSESDFQKKLKKFLELPTQ